MKNYSVITLAVVTASFWVCGCQPAPESDASGTRPQTMSSNGISSEELGLRLAMRDLWADHVWLTRDYINSAATDHPDKETVAERLLKNQDEIGSAVKPYFGDEASDKLTALLREHILIATEVVSFAKAGNDAGLATANAKWSVNANEIADLLSSANPDHWKQDEMRAMMQEHLKLTTDETVTRLKGDWKGNIMASDKALDQAMSMADMLSDGLVAKFPEKF